MEFSFFFAGCSASALLFCASGSILDSGFLSYVLPLNWSSSSSEDGEHKEYGTKSNTINQKWKKELENKKRKNSFMKDELNSSKIINCAKVFFFLHLLEEEKVYVCRYVEQNWNTFSPFLEWICVFLLFSFSASTSSSSYRLVLIFISFIKNWRTWNYAECTFTNIIFSLWVEFFVSY